MAFATTDDIELRLGREITAEEAAMAEQVIEAVTAQIVDAVDRDADWAENLDPVPGLLKTLCIEKVIVVGTNPSGLASETESLGAHSYGRTFPRVSDNGLFLTADEQRLVRMAVYGANAATARQESLVDELPYRPIVIPVSGD